MPTFIGMMKCVSGKRSYASQNLAEEALIEAHINFEYRPRNGPTAVYKCEECGNFHLTSLGEMNAQLALQLKNGYIQKQKQAIRWKNKLK